MSLNQITGIVAERLSPERGGPEKSGLWRVTVVPAKAHRHPRLRLLQDSHRLKGTSKNP